MSKIEAINCDSENIRKLRMAVLKKYGKIRGYLGKEVSIAIFERAEKLEAELEGV